MSAPIGTTAAVVGLPAAAPLLDAARRIDPALGRPDAAHVTALYPFVPAAALTEDVERAVRGLAAWFPVTEVLLTRITTAPGFVAAPAPELQPLLDAFRARWPQLVPYGGRFGPRPEAHVTVAMGADGTAAARIGAAARPLLPRRCRAESVEVVELTERGWHLRFSAPLGTGSQPRRPEGELTEQRPGCRDGDGRSAVADAEGAARASRTRKWPE